MQRSKLISPPCTWATRSSAPTTFRAGLARFVSLGPAREHRDAQRPPGAIRQVDDAAHHLVGVLGIDAEIDRKLHRLVEFGGGVGLDQLDGVLELVKLGPLDRLTRLQNSLAVMRHRSALHHLKAHRAGRAFDHLDRRFDRVAVEVRDLLLGDLAHLVLGHLADEAAPGRLGAGGGLLTEL